MCLLLVIPAALNGRRAGQAGGAFQQTKVWSSSVYAFNDLQALGPSLTNPSAVVRDSPLAKPHRTPYGVPLAGRLSKKALPGAKMAVTGERPTGFDQHGPIRAA